MAMKKRQTISPIRTPVNDRAAQCVPARDFEGANADPLERLELALERERIKGRMAIALLTDFAALEARTREALDSLECPSYRTLDRCEAPEIVWLVVEPMVGTNGSVRAFRHQKTAKSYAGHGTRGLVTGPYSRHTLPSTGDVELARQVLRENFDGRPRDDVGPYRDAHNVPAIAYELGRRDGVHAEQHRAAELAATRTSDAPSFWEPAALDAEAVAREYDHAEDAHAAGVARRIAGRLRWLGRRSGDAPPGKKFESTGEPRNDAKTDDAPARND